MSSEVSDASSPTRARLGRRIGWAMVWLVLGIISIHFLLTVYGKYHYPDPGSYTMFWSRRGWLWTHLAGGALTVVLGPLQFLTRWPRAYPRLHRWMGRIYMVGMLIACTGATGLIATSPAPFEIRIAFTATALAWLTTALVALIAIHRGRVWPHRRWMIRNYLVTLSPITFRILLQAQIAMELAPSPAMIATLLWLSWLLPLVIYEGGYRIVDLMRATLLRRARIDVPSSPRIDIGSA
ncbi:DUF2306 domain-containing protein [Pseudoxanthomonas sacheonensis]|uniref:DUF2306 domain-containing protein n=1 Tax=Pseudoxanthomonas sacheonensis TaxID=443615 RepID=UPI0013D059A6|nr:DUF2306 domain-containing protein [Pseudoxanthomonas sacheonensis]KAF1708684.1 hypothetical protein CSC73_08290 [Pseudoxanthomonas sacheonensis]